MENSDPFAISKAEALDSNSGNNKAFSVSTIQSNCSALLFLLNICTFVSYPLHGIESIDGKETGRYFRVDIFSE